MKMDNRSYTRYQYDEAYRTLRMMSHRTDNYRRDSNEAAQAGNAVSRAYGTAGIKAIDSINNRNRPVKVGQSQWQIKRWLKQKKWDAEQKAFEEYIAKLKAQRIFVTENASERA